MLIAVNAIATARVEIVANSPASTTIRNGAKSGVAGSVSSSVTAPSVSTASSQNGHISPVTAQVSNGASASRPPSTTSGGAPRWPTATTATTTCANVVYAGTHQGTVMPLWAMLASSRARIPLISTAPD